MGGRISLENSIFHSGENVLQVTRDKIVANDYSALEILVAIVVPHVIGEYLTIELHAIVGRRDVTHENTTTSPIDNGAVHVLQTVGRKYDKKTTVVHTDRRGQHLQKSSYPGVLLTREVGGRSTILDQPVDLVNQNQHASLDRKSVV